ncbi:MAG: hypothetical protein ACPHAS_01420 [Synechococcus sp.]
MQSYTCSDDCKGDGDGEGRNPTSVWVAQRFGQRLNAVAFAEEFFLTAFLADRAVDPRVFELEAKTARDIDKVAALAATKGED